MELYGSTTSPFVRHARIVLLETGLPCEFIEVASTDPKNRSPTKKVPYLQDGDLGLSDSSSIIKHLREKSGGRFIPDIADFDLYCLANTLMDAAVNVFLFEKVDKLLPAQSAYLTRQVARVEAGLSELATRNLPSALPLGDAQIRVATFLSWGRFRNRLSLEGHPGLQTFLALAESWDRFAATAPPQDA